MDESGQGIRHQLHVGAASIALRAVPEHQALLLEDAKVMRQQVRRHFQQALELTRCGVAQRQAINDPEPRGLRQRCVESRTTLDVVVRWHCLDTHCLNIH